jgi:hypothetical protein
MTVKQILILTQMMSKEGVVRLGRCVLFPCNIQDWDLQLGSAVYSAG